MADMVEEMARAIRDARFVPFGIEPYPFEQEDAHGQEYSQRLAQACLAAVEKRIEELTPIFERVTRLADTLASDVPITAEARKHIERAYEALSALVLKGNSNG